MEVEMTNSNVQHGNGRTIAEILNEFKEELKQFAQTRIEMLRSEMTEKVGSLKAAVPALAIALLMAVGAFLAFTAALIAGIALFFHARPWAYAASAGIVFLLYAIVAGIAAASGISAIKSTRMAPEKTIRVLQQDKLWLTTEARTQV
jgi:uncharacterized membrane protein YqjE